MEGHLHKYNQIMSLITPAALEEMKKDWIKEAKEYLDTPMRWYALEYVSCPFDRSGDLIRYDLSGENEDVNELFEDYFLQDPESCRTFPSEIKTLAEFGEQLTGQWDATNESGYGKRWKTYHEKMEMYVDAMVDEAAASLFNHSEDDETFDDWRYDDDIQTAICDAEYDILQELLKTKIQEEGK